MARGNAVAIVLAAGAGARMAAETSKAFLILSGRPLLDWSVSLFESVKEVQEVLVVVAPQDRTRYEALAQEAGWSKVHRMVEGGATRHDSEFKGLEALTDRIEDGAVELVLVHDAARPFATAALVGELVRQARKHGAAIPGLPAAGNIARAGADGSLSPAPQDLWIAQTPQVFAARLLLDAHRRARRDGFKGSDSASVVERAGQRVIVVEGSYDNIKITMPGDLVRAEQIARHRADHPDGASLMTRATTGA